MANILVVNDKDQIRSLLAGMLKMNDYDCTLAASAMEARECLNDQSFDLVLCDVTMSEESGIELASHIGAKYEDTAVIIVSEVDDPKITDAAIEAGAYGYIIKPFKQKQLLISVQNALRRRKLEIANRNYQQNLEQKVEERTAKLKGALYGVIQAMGRTIEYKDPYTAGHQRRVANLAVIIAMEMSIPQDHLEWILMAGKIHDIGKISVPIEILSKPAKLTEYEFAFLMTHPKVGCDIIAGIEFPWPIDQIILQHHEKINGTGYPQGLSGNDILLEARILCVADVVEAMASQRPYRPELGIKAALSEVSENRGVLYDPNVVDALSRISTSNIAKILR